MSGFSCHYPFAKSICNRQFAILLGPFKPFLRQRIVSEHIACDSYIVFCT